MDSTFNPEKWQTKRSATTKAFVIQCCVLGMEYSVTFLTLWIYVTTLVETSNPKLYYSIISASYLLSAVLFSMVIGRWVDRTRNIRVMFLVCNTSVIVGNIMYSLHHSPWLLVVGRFLCGIGGPLRSVMSGEVSRCYPSDQVMSKFSMLGTAFSLGFIMGPGVNFVFKDVDVVWGPFHLTSANVAGFYMAALFLITQIIVFFTVSDLSKEYDLKSDEVLYKQSVQQQIIPSTVRKTSDLEDKTLLKKALLTSSYGSYNDGIHKQHLLVPNQLQNLESSTNSVFLNYANSSIDNVSITSLPIPYRGRSVTYESTRSLNVHRNLLLDSHTHGVLIHSTAGSSHLQKSVAVEKIEKPALFPQTFTRSDAMLTASITVVDQNLCHYQTGEQIPLLEEGEATPSVGSILKQIVGSVDAVLVFVLSFTMYFWMVAFDMWLPMMIIDVLGYGMTELNGIVFGFGCISAVVLLLLSWKRFSDKAMYKLSLVCVLSLGIMELIFGSMKLFQQNLYVNAALWVVWGTLFAIVVIMDEVFLIGILAKMTSSRIQTFNESLRLSMTRGGALVALLTSAMVFNYVEYMCLAGIVFSVLAFFVLLCRRKTFSNPTLIIK